MNKQTRIVVERALMARPNASIQDLRNLVPALRAMDDDAIERSVAPIREARAKVSLARKRTGA